jgi:hypothetical protein
MGFDKHLTMTQRAERADRRVINLPAKIPDSLVEHAPGTAICLGCGTERLVNEEGNVLWHIGVVKREAMYDDETARKYGCLGVGLPGGVV